MIKIVCVVALFIALFCNENVHSFNPQSSPNSLCPEVCPKGSMGLHGLDGMPGRKGERGEKGEVVAVSSSHLQSSPNLPCPAVCRKGDRGERGLPGLDGPDGLPGPKGERGEKGSAIVVTQNGDLTVVQGEKGEMGDRGPMGPPGPRRRRCWGRPNLKGDNCETSGSFRKNYAQLSENLEAKVELMHDTIAKLQVAVQRLQQEDK